MTANSITSPLGCRIPSLWIRGEKGDSALDKKQNGGLQNPGYTGQGKLFAVWLLKVLVPMVPTVCIGRLNLFPNVERNGIVTPEKGIWILAWFSRG